MSLPFVVFEGLDGSGKTTLAKLCAEQMNGRYYGFPPPCLEDAWKMVARMSPEARYFFCAFANFIEGDEIKELCSSMPVFCDRYVYSTSLYHSVFTRKELPVPSVEKLPDLIVYTHANWDVLESRLKARSVADVFESRDNLRSVERRYEALFSGSEKVFRIDTSYETPEKSAQRICEFLKKKNPETFVA